MHQRPFPVERGTFINVILRDLEKPYERFLTEEQDAIVEANQAITKAPCFMVGATMYAKHGVVSIIGRNKLGNVAGLDASLYAEFEQWLAHRNEHQKSWQHLSQSLKLVIMRASSWQDLRDMLPDRVLKPYLDMNTPMRGLPRTCVDLHTAHLRFQESSSWVTSCWEQDLVEKYAAISDAIDTYVGYHLL